MRGHLLIEPGRLMAKLLVSWFAIWEDNTDIEYILDLPGFKDDQGWFHIASWGNQ